MTECSCWVKYPNENHRFKNGRWKCIDRYVCIRDLEVEPLPGLPFPKYWRKTKCVKMAEEEKMTDREKAIVMAYTGKCMLTGNKFQIFHKYVEDIMGRPIMTHEMAFLADVIKEKSKADFIALCADESGESEEKNE